MEGAGQGVRSISGSVVWFLAELPVSGDCVFLAESLRNAESWRQELFILSTDVATFIRCRLRGIATEEFRSVLRSGRSFLCLLHAGDGEHCTNLCCQWVSGI